MRALIPVILSLVTVTACGGSPSAPTAPTPNPSGTLTSLSGTWAGPSSDTSGPAMMTWVVSQSGITMAGTMNISDSGRGMMGNGSVQGTISGSTVTFHMTVPNAGFNGMMSSCSMSVDGQAQMSDDGHTMTGTYSGTMSGMMSQMQSCGGAMNNGHVTLTR
jgi:osmotically-inducible protein OsmY